MTVKKKTNKRLACTLFSVEILALVWGKKKAVSSNRQGSCQNHNMSYINNSVASVRSWIKRLSALVLSLGRNRNRWSRKSSSRPALSEQRRLTCLCGCRFFLLSVWLYGCEHTHTHMCTYIYIDTQPLQTGTDESARLQPCSVQCIMGFRSLRLSSSLSHCWHGVRVGMSSPPV